MKKNVRLTLAFLVALGAQTSFASNIDAGNYSLTKLNGSYSYGRTNWNASPEFGMIDNISELPAVESLFSDGYIPLASAQTGLINGIYSRGYGFYSIEFSFNDGSDHILSALSFLSSRAQRDSTAITLEYALNGSDWQVATSTTSGDLGMTSGAALGYDLSFGGVKADAFRITMNGGGQISLHEIAVSGQASAASPVPVPAAVWLFGSGLIGLFGIRKTRSLRSTVSA